MIFNIDILASLSYTPAMQNNGQFFADKLMDLANLGFAALVFGQFLGGNIRWEIVVAGFAFFYFCIMLSFFFRKGVKAE